MNVYTAETYRAPHLRYYNVSREKYPRRENEMDSPSFEGFHDRLDWLPFKLQIIIINIKYS